MAHFDFWPPGGRVYLVIKTLKWQVRAFKIGIFGQNLAGLVLGHSRRGIRACLYFWTPVDQVYLVTKTLKWLLEHANGDEPKAP